MHISLIAKKTDEVTIPSNRELALQSVRKNFSELRQKMKSLEEEYKRRGINLESIESFDPIPPPTPPVSVKISRQVRIQIMKLKVHL